MAVRKGAPPSGRGRLVPMAERGGHASLPGLQDTGATPPDTESGLPPAPLAARIRGGMEALPPRPVLRSDPVQQLRSGGAVRGAAGRGGDATPARVADGPVRDGDRSAAFHFPRPARVLCD